TPELAGRLGVELSRDRRGERPGAVQGQSPAPRPLARQAGEDLPLGHGADAGDLLEPSLRRCRAQVVGGPDAERPAERDHPLRAEADEAPQRDELRLDLALELLELGETAGGDELVEACGDPRPDA